MQTTHQLISSVIGPSSPSVQERLRAIGLADLVLIGIAVLAMASARYLG